MGCYAKVTHYWTDESTTVVEFGSSEASHPDLLDELASRCLRMWERVIADSGEDVDGDVMEIGEADG